MQLQIRRTAVDRGALRPARERLALGSLGRLHEAERLEEQIRRIEERREQGRMITCSADGIDPYYDALGAIAHSIIENKGSLRGQSVAMITLDKSRQNAINYLLGREHGGNASLDAAIECIRKAIDETFGPVLSGGNKPYVMRYSPFSDEITIIVVAKGITREMLERFQANLDRAVESIDLSRFTWEAKNGERKACNLASASGIFRYPRMVAKSKISGRVLWKVDLLGDKDFLKKGAAEADVSKLSFINNLPPAYREVEGIPDVISPFTDMLGTGNLQQGTVAEIKLQRRLNSTEWEAEADALLSIAVRDAKKCLYEMRSGILGRKLFNVLKGVSGCNATLVAPVLMGAHAFGKTHDIVVAPSEDMNFLFFGAEMSDDLLMDLNRHVSQFLSPHFMPHISAMSTDGLTPEQLRPEFELIELDMHGRATHEDLESANLLVNLIENASAAIKRRVFDGVSPENRRALERAEAMFSEERTIRNMQDYTFTAIATGRDDLVGWLWGFAQQHAGAIKERLLTTYAH